MFGNIGSGELLIIILVVTGISIIPFIFYLLSLQKTLTLCSSESRTTSPSSVWLLLIPIFSIVWHFILVSRISESLHNEFTKRNMVEDTQPGKSLGIAFGVCGLCSLIPILGIIASIGALVCFIMYWVKISGYSGKLTQPTLVH